jgi:cytochrome c oxidase subunit 3
MATMHKDVPYYYVPHDSKWPILGSASLLLWGMSAAGFVNGQAWASTTLTMALLSLIAVLYCWFSDVVGESEKGIYSQRIDMSFRWSMGWFIFSEVMFFAALFGALFYARNVTMPWLGDLDHKSFLWPDFNAQWPNLGPAKEVEPFQKMGPFPIPTINTLLLLSSGVTLTIAHHALLAGQRAKTSLFLFLTIGLGAVFTGFQAYEYMHAYSELNLKLTSGIFGATFYMLTGFHGFHVLVGSIMLAVMLARILKGHFTKDHHFAFEAAAWYWHFVDVVWLGLYVVVYWL